MKKLDTLAKAVGMELCILGFIGLVFLFQYDKATDELVSKTKAIGETIGEQASVFFTGRKDKATSDEFFLFLDERLGRKKLFNTFDIAPKFFSVVLRSDIERSGFSDRYKEDFYPTGGYTVKKVGGSISVSVPFLRSGESSPFGIVKIESSTRTLMQKVLMDNFLLYSAILLVLNNQAFILYLILRRKREVVFEKGYLKEHSIGALTIFHKVLGDIIADHEMTGAELKEQPAESAQDEKVVSISKKIRKKGS